MIIDDLRGDELRKALLNDTIIKSMTEKAKTFDIEDELRYSYSCPQVDVNTRLLHISWTLFPQFKDFNEEVAGYLRYAYGIYAMI